jgi:hypothetical protein
MVDRFKRVFPSKGRNHFDGGKNNKFERSLIGDNESPDCLNVVFEDGAVGTRGGSTKFNTTAIGSFSADGFYVRHDTDNSETMIVFANGVAHELTGTSTFVSITSSESLFTGGVRVAAAEYQDHIFFGNGNAEPHKWNGTDYTRHGVPAPTATHSVASNTTSTGVLTGDYRWKVTYINSALAEGDLGPVPTTLTVTSAEVLITSLPIAPQSFGVNQRKIYRTVTSGAAYKLVTTINDNTTTTYDDNIADADLGVAAPTDNGVPPKYNSIVYHQNRLFVNDTAQPNYVFYSDIAEPYTFGALSFFRVGDATSDLVKGLAVYNDQLIIFCDNSIWINYMPDSTASNWIQVRAKSAYGSKSPFGLPVFQNSVLFPATQNSKFVGFGAISGTTVEPDVALLTVGGLISDLQSNRIEPDMFDVQEAYVRNIAAITYKNRIYISVTYGNGNTENNRMFVYDYDRDRLSQTQRGAWVPYDGMNAAQFAIYDQKLYYAESGANGLHVYEMEVSGTYSDDSAAINSYYWTKEFSGNPGHETVEKDFRTSEMLVDQAGAWPMDLFYRVNSDLGQGTQEVIDLTPGGSTWNNFTWNNELWGGGRAEDEKTLYMANARGRRIQFKFSNQNVAGQRFKVHGQNFSYNIKGTR